MIGVISNPKKSFRIERQIAEVKSAIENLMLFTKTYKLNKANTVLNQFTYEATEFLSVGVYIDINFFFVNETQTEITIEVRRKIGSFDQSHEITNANNHIAKITDLVTQSITAGTEGRQLMLDQIEADKKMKADLEKERRFQELEEKQDFPIQYYTKLTFRWILGLSILFGLWFLIYKMLVNI
jgi:hypothetical protein